MGSNLDALEAMIAEQEAAERAAKESAPNKAQAERAASQAAGKASGQGDPEIQAMNAEVDLLSVIQADTGEQGHASGDRIDFNECPVCGHRDCFRYYPDTNSWSCYSSSNDSGFEGGMFTEYMRAAHGCDKTEAVKKLREATGHPYKGKREYEPLAWDVELGSDDDTPNSKGKSHDGEQGGDALQLPSWESIRATKPPKRNPILIDGVVRQGHVMLLAGKGKVGKSWSAIELCVSVATGRAEWFGLPLQSSGACLYIDPELDPKSLDNRFKAVCDAMNVDTAKADGMIAKWSLRGVPGASMDAIIHDLKARCEFGQFALVVIDSCSCFMEGDENKSVDVRRFAAKVLQITKITGATALLIHHFGKSRDGDRSAADRARGSSVWLDFPDAVLTLTEILPPSGELSDYLQPGEYACILEPGGIREFPRMEPVRLVFGYPIHRVDDKGITDSWKPNSSQRDGAKQTNELKAAQKAAQNAGVASALLAHYYAEGIGEDGLILKEAAEAVNLDSRQLTTALEGCEHFEIVQVTQRKRYVRPKRSPRASPPELPLSEN